MSRLEDAQLVRRFLETGSPEFFEKLVVRYRRLGGAAAYKILEDYEAAADVVQDAFVKAHEKLDSLKDPSKFKSWFYGIVRTTALDALRKRKRSPMRFSSMKGRQRLISDSDAIDPLTKLKKQERIQRIHEEVQNLPENYREVVYLKYLDGRSYKEIAEITGLSVSAVESRLFRARNQLKERFKALSIR